ncbi:DUF4232 domain-containing protein [Saccharothrix sp. AJ9571]|nr:DUF4232 domain-containing protein [Saccharothrix sp. AJ9571]
MSQQPTRTRALRRITLTAAALGATSALTACGTAAPPEVSTVDAQPVAMTGAQAGDGLCKAASLDLGLIPDEGGAGMNKKHLNLRFTNKSGTACSLQGSPGVSFVAGDDGHQLGEPAERVPADQGTLVRIVAGGYAQSPLTVVNAGVYDEAECRPALSRGLRVYAPGDTAAMFVPFEQDACTVAGQHQLSADVVR